ncbi:MAG TPA: ATP-binding protein, partial [Candidatus Cloacimonetes bacterium]|nr:ATP-binding protein [Candidatus Cloacimonadota bacterium]
MIKRESTAVLKRMAATFPVVSITGPRQSGKTTLVQNVFPEKEYISLEDPIERDLAITDPKKFFSRFPNGAIIDEVQRIPDLFSYIQIIVDERKVMGDFILTGSNQFEYMRSLSQSLAGRTAILKLLPFSYQEIFSDKKEDINKILFKGMFPAIYDRNLDVDIYFRSYINTYLERDVRQLINIVEISKFQRFLELCAGWTGRILNKSSIASAVGISQPTVENWLSVLEASFIIYRLRPFYKNLKKRLTKSSKLYFFDTGLICKLLRIENFKQLLTHPLQGEIFENFVVSEFLKYRLHKGLDSNLYYFRDSHGNEVDIIIETGYGSVPIEIKSGQTINFSFFKGLDIFGKLEHGYKSSGLIYGG